MDELKPCHFRQVDNHGRILCGIIKSGDREVSVQLCRACPVSQINCQNLRAGLEKKTSTPITVRFATGRVEVWNNAPPTIEFKQAACAAKTMPINSPRDCAGCPIRLPNVIPQTALQVAHRSKQPIAGAGPAIIAPHAAAPQRSSRSAVRGTQAAAGLNAAQPIGESVTPTAAQHQTISEATARASAQPASIDVGMANDLIARARATAERKAAEKRQREIERLAQEQQAQVAAQAGPETKPKIIQMKEWLASQMNKKAAGTPTNSPFKPQAVQPDADGVSDIIYSPLGMQAAAGAYQETIDYERCVGWTD
ncbi:MAG: hypothetical protein IT331_04410 [Anaerolineae bacterium]|nr:hypothetical protein [Anaerolineae bacterium]